MGLLSADQSQRLSLPTQETSPRWQQPQQPPQAAQGKKKSWFSCLLVTLSMAALYLLTSSDSSFTLSFMQWSPWDGGVSRAQFKALAVPSESREMGGTRQLRVFMPADSGNMNLCKTVMSAVALGYPAPILVNWKGEFNHPQWAMAGSHIAKLESWLAAMEDLLDNDPDAHDNDLALLVDSYDVWFQLPPSVLIKRYHQLNREADERVHEQWMAAAKGAPAGFPVSPPKHSIVVTSAKNCAPDTDSGSDPHYDHWPQSPMPDDMYGDGTDQLARSYSGPARKFRKIRPRCVNSGFMMGTMGSLRAALSRARAKVHQASRMGRQLWSDQALIAEVIGDQQLWREWMLDLGRTWNGTASESSLSSLHPSVRKVARSAMAGTAYEFGIGLDYNFTTVPATCSSEEDGDFVHLGNQDEVDMASYKMGVAGPARIQGVPGDLQELAEDGQKLQGAANPIASGDWRNVSLYADMWFGVVPVGIHHNAYVDGLKPWRLANWWSKMWFYPALRSIVTSQLSGADDSAASPLAKLPAMHPDGNGVVYKAPNGKGAKSVTVYTPKNTLGPAAFEPISWEGVCQKGSTPWYDELFGDNKGPLVL